MKKGGQIAFGIHSPAIGRFPISDGSFDDEIHGFFRDSRGLLDSTLRMMPLIPSEYRSNPTGQPAALTEGVIAIIPWLRFGDVPEILILTKGETQGVWRFTPWTRASGTTTPAITAVLGYTTRGSYNVKWSGKQVVPASGIPVINGVIFTFGDASGVWFWDGERVKPLGFSMIPDAPVAWGPQRSGTSPNGGGFTVRGRIGTTEGSWTTDASLTVGGIDEGEWRYARVLQTFEGGCSAPSAESGSVTTQAALANPDADPADDPTPMEDLLRAFRVQITQGPPDTARNILLRTANLKRLPEGDRGEMHFHSVIGHNAQDIDLIDTIPDGELGDVWDGHEAQPVGVYFLLEFDGCLWQCRTDGAPARMWHSERTANGPRYDSIPRGGYLDVLPSTGPITAALAVPWSGSSGPPVCLVFKETSVAYLTGGYPVYSVGTMHPGAGCAGHRLVQASPDGSIIWYGRGTFWRYRMDTGIKDIGDPLRRKLLKVNASQAVFGQSWVNPLRAEVVFVLPVDGLPQPTMQFVWDADLQTWLGTRSDLSITAAAFCFSDLLLIGGSYGGTTTLFVYGRGYTGWTFTSPTWTLATGWRSPSEGPDISKMHTLTDLLLVCEDRCDETATASIYTDWNGDTAETSATIEQKTPGQTDIPYYGTAVFDTAVWRTRRPFLQRAPTGGQQAIVAMIKVVGTAPFAMFTAYSVGTPEVTGPGAQVPQADQG